MPRRRHRPYARGGLWSGADGTELREDSVVEYSARVATRTGTWTAARDRPSGALQQWAAQSSPQSQTPSRSTSPEPDAIEALKTSVSEAGFTPWAGGARKANARTSDSRRRKTLTRHSRFDLKLKSTRIIHYELHEDDGGGKIA
jgi:hypothetical protein